MKIRAFGNPSLSFRRLVPLCQDPVRPKDFHIFEVVLCIRTWAIWRRNKVIGAGLVALLIASLVLECIELNREVRSFGRMSSGLHSMSFNLRLGVLVARPLFPGFRGCLFSNSPTNLWINYAMLAILQAGKYRGNFPLHSYQLTPVIIVVLALVVISAVRSCPFALNSLLTSIAQPPSPFVAQSGFSSQLSHVIHRDGQLKFFIDIFECL